MSSLTYRRSGRPDHLSSEALIRHIVDTAARLFIDQGYPATSLEQIAAEAGAGKQTLYRRFGSKEGLFSEVINREVRALLEAASSSETPGADPIDALRQSCRSLFDFALRPDMIRLHRALVAEVGRFPELGEGVLKNCMEPYRALLRRQLQAAMDAKRIRVADVELVMSLAMSLVTGWPTQQSLLGREPFSTTEERERYFDAAWTLFLNGVGGARMPERGAACARRSRFPVQQELGGKLTQS